MSSILWVGPGMGEYYFHWWVKAFIHLVDNGLVIDRVRSIDLKGAPNRFFNPNNPDLGEDFNEETLRANFFDQEPGWDIIILDFIEAWLFGKNYWPLSETPYKTILHEWEAKILELRPQQVWTIHDSDPHSTIIPNLSPDYELIDIGLEPFFYSRQVDVWKLVDREDPTEDLTDLQKALKELDLSLTGKAHPSVVSRYPANTIRWADDQLVYLSDGGYSRIYIDLSDLEDPQILLGSESLDAAKDRWEESFPLVERIQQILREQIDSYF